MELTEKQRARVVNEVKMNIINHELENEIASKVLFQILNNYQRDGQPCHKELSLSMHNGAARKIVIHLYNNKSIQDIVSITKV
jgi:hypothetical protein